MYLITFIRPHIAYIVRILSKYMSNPSIDYWNKILNLLMYMRYTRSYDLHYKRYIIIVGMWFNPSLKNSSGVSGSVQNLYKKSRRMVGPGAP